MRFAIVVGLVMSSAFAHADSKADVEALIKKNLDAVASNNQAAFDATFRKDAYKFLPSNDITKLVDMFHGRHSMNVKQTITTITVVADDSTKVAWFHVQFDAKYEAAMMNPDGSTPKLDEKLRMVGIAIDDKGWKIAAAMYGHAIPDKRLFERADSEMTKPDKPVVRGERSTAEWAMKWFTRGMAVDQAKGTVVVNGTAPGEYGIGTVAATIVTAWDKLKLWPIKITGRRWGTYPIGLVKAEVAMPMKSGAARMRLAAIVVPDGKEWRWVSLCFFSYFEEQP